MTSILLFLRSAWSRLWLARVFGSSRARSLQPFFRASAWSLMRERGRRAHALSLALRAFAQSACKSRAGALSARGHDCTASLAGWQCIRYLLWHNSVMAGTGFRQVTCLTVRSSGPLRVGCGRLLLTAAAAA